MATELEFLGRDGTEQLVATVKNLIKNAGCDWSAPEGEPGHVLNRTHYESEEIVNEPLNITWDGNTEGLVNVDADGDIYWKLSDTVLSDAQIKSATFMISVANEPIVAADDWDWWVSDGFVTEGVVWTSYILFVRKPNSVMWGVTFPEVGIYSCLFGSTDGECYVSSLTTTEPVEQTKTTVHKLDEKFIPSTIARTSDIPESYSKDDMCGAGSTYSYTWDGTLTNEYFTFNAITYYKVSDDAIPYEYIANVSATSPNGTFTSFWEGDGCYGVSGGIVVTEAGSCRLKPTESSTSFDYFEAPSTGVYFLYRTDYRFYYTNITLTTNVSDYFPSGRTIVSFGNDANGKPLGWKSASIPTKVSELENDSGYALLTDLPDAVITPTTAQVGQTIVVKTVDETGKPTEWEAVDLPETSTLIDRTTGKTYTLYVDNGKLHMEEAT